MRFSRFLVALCSTLIAVAAPRSGLADGMTALLWSRPQHEDDALRRRVRGQVSDLSVILEPVEAARGDSLGEQLEQADALAGARGAKVVVWFEPLPGRAGLLVVVAQTAGGRVLVRRLEPRAAAPAPAAGLAALDSATLESASLVVRTSLRALSEGGVIGIAREDLAEAPASSPAARAGPAAPRPPAMASSPSASGGKARLEWVADVGWQAAYDGSAVQQGLAMRVGPRVGPWSFGFYAAQSFGKQLPGPYATLELSRDAFAAFAEVAWFRTREASASVGLSAGAVLFPRATVSTSSGVRATAAELNPTYAAGVDLPFRWSPDGLRQRLGFWISAGVDFIPAAPTLGYDLGTSFVPVAHLWPLQPHLGAGVEVSAF